MNHGRFTATMYIKHVCIGKAVLWKDRQISLRKDIIDKIHARGIRKIVFVDKGRGEKWVFDPAKVFETMILKREGQEDQYYFPIELAKKKKIERVVPVKYVFDEIRRVYVEASRVKKLSTGEQIIQCSLF